MMDSDHSDLYEKADLFEGPGIDQAALEKTIEQMLLLLGEDPGREGLQRTPERVARMYGELLSGYRMDPLALVNDALFEVSYDEMVIVRDIEFYSLCEHHLLPFLGRAHVAYLPRGRVLGLSKIPRLVDMCARRHPTQIYEMLLAAAILGAVIAAIGTSRGRGLAPLERPGGLFLGFLALSAFARLLLEAFRGDSALLSAGLRSAQVGAWLVLALCLWGLGKLQPAELPTETPQQLDSDQNKGEMEPR